MLCLKLLNLLMITLYAKTVLPQKIKCKFANKKEQIDDRQYCPTAQVLAVNTD